jgi:CRP-like cAMP-binding protein
VQLDSSAFVADPELTRALQERSTPVRCDTDHLLFRQDDRPTGVFILLQGAATLTMKSFDGRDIFSLQPEPGSLLGLPAVVSDHPYSLSAVARAGAQVSFVTRADFFAVMEAHPALCLKMLQVLAAEVRTARRALY